MYDEDTDDAYCEHYNDEDDDLIKMIVLRNNDSVDFRLEITDDNKIRNV